jgi:hypothetical protein
VGVALMIVVFTQTGGLTGAEVGVAGGTAVLAQRLLEAVFGDDTVRRLTRLAKEQLDARIEAVLAVELARYDRALGASGVDPSAAAAIRGGVDAVMSCIATEPALAAAQAASALTRSEVSGEVVSGIVLDPVVHADGIRVEVPDEG